MAVYFACRSPYVPPGGKYLKRFEDVNVLDWFRARWHRLAGTDADEVSESVEQELGCPLYSFHCLFLAVAEQGLALPSSPSELRADLADNVYINDILCDSVHLLQVGTDDDEVGLSYYFFDDHFLARNRKRAAFLLQGDWRLPGGCGAGNFRPREPTLLGRPKGHGQGKTWLVDLDHVGDLDDLVPAYRLEGIRLPELAKYLARGPGPEGFPEPLNYLSPLLLVEGAGARDVEKAFLAQLREQPGDEATWNAYSDWLQDDGKAPAGLYLLQRALTRAGLWQAPDYVLPKTAKFGVGDKLFEGPRTSYPVALPLAEHLDRHRPAVPPEVHVEDHLAQLCFRESYWAQIGRSIYEQWALFDDLWASAHPDLANAILRYVQRWDVLSSSRTRSEWA
jgi:uncharacterized protein (TIGR02996 family)